MTGATYMFPNPQPAMPHPGPPSHVGHWRGRFSPRSGWRILVGGGVLAALLKPAAVSVACAPTTCRGPVLSPPLPGAEPWAGTATGVTADLSNGCVPADARRAIDNAHEVAFAVGKLGYPLDLTAGLTNDTPSQLVHDTVHTMFPGARLVFRVPGAEVGYCRWLRRCSRRHCGPDLRAVRLAQYVTGKRSTR